MKRFIALVLAIIMLSALALPAMATTSVTGDASAPVGTTTKVIYTVGETYVFTAPIRIEVDGKDGDITVTKYNLCPENMVRVSVSAPTWKLGEAAYKINDVSEDGVIAEFTHTSYKTIKATFVADPPYAAGTYSETVTFISTIVPRKN